jgi:hypothetical protein
MMVLFFAQSLFDIIKELKKLSKTVTVFEQKYQNIVLVNSSNVDYTLIIKNWIVNIHEFVCLVTVLCLKLRDSCRLFIALVIYASNFMGEVGFANIFISQNTHFVI